jgi:hypothetical protein
MNIDIYRVGTYCSPKDIYRAHAMNLRREERRGEREREIEDDFY